MIEGESHVLVVINGLLSRNKCELRYRGERIDYIDVAVVSEQPPEGSGGVRYQAYLGTSEHEDHPDGAVGVKTYVLTVDAEGVCVSEEEKWLMAGEAD